MNQYHISASIRKSLRELLYETQEAETIDGVLTTLTEFAEKMNKLADRIEEDEKNVP